MTRRASSYSTALALSLCTAGASAQTITTAAALGAIAQVPVDGPMALGLLVIALGIAAAWQLRRAPITNRILAWAAVGTIGLAMHDPGLFAAPFNAFTNPAGETRTIAVNAITSGTDFTGFQQQEFTNQSGAPLRITGLVPPNMGQCFTGANTADKLLQPGTPSGSATPLCQVGNVLANGNACRVDVDAHCRGLLGPAPTLSSVSPNSGRPIGGTPVALTGTNLTGSSSVSFGGTWVTPVSTTSSTIVVNTPPHPIGVVEVAVRTAAGTVKLPAAFTYTIAPPIGTSLYPNNIQEPGGIPVTITGTGFVAGDTTVSIGAMTIPANEVVVMSSTSLTFIAPPHAPGNVPVSISTTAGTSPPVPGGITYYGIPVIGAISPNSGPVAGGSAVTMTGVNFTGVYEVRVNGIPVPSFTVNADSAITFVTPPGEAGNTVVSVISPGGTAAAGGFTYQ